MWRAIPGDALALVVIVFGMYAVQRAYIFHGLCFNDPSWYFHFGNRLVEHGDVPYRDYVFQVGPLPIFVDAAFQSVFGAKYQASLFAGLFIRALRIWVVWMLVRRVAHPRAAVLIGVFCALDPLFSFAHHWSLGYSQLFISLAGLWLLLASRLEGPADHRRELVYLGLAGLSAAFVVTARQSSAVMIAVVLFGLTTFMLLRGSYFTRRRYAALWTGFVAGIVVVFGALAILGAAGPALQQMFLDAPQKKGVGGLTAVLDALTGGAVVLYQHDPNFTWWGGFLFFLGLPIALVAGVVYLASRETKIDSGTLAMLIVPGAMILGLLTRYGVLGYWNDVNRTFFTATTIVAMLWPDRARRWFGLEPLVMVGLGAIPLASDWALEMSFPTRGWGDGQSLVLGVLLFALASRHLTVRIKTALCGALAIAGIIHFLVAARVHVNPFAKEEARDGLLTETTGKSSHPKLAGMRVGTWRRESLAWLRRTVPPGSSCFVYANMPVIYTLLDCRNPTRIDSTTADFITAGDAEDALVALRASPPEYLLAHENTWMNPPLTLDLKDDDAAYGGLNPKASRAMHTGLRTFLARYEEIGYVADVLGPEQAALAGMQWDQIQMLRIYRRKP